MASHKENFFQTGPSFLTAVDWNDFHHRRSVAASLVQGVYTMEHDRQQNRQGPYAMAPPWWQFFHFDLFQILVDEDDVSYCGAIFKNTYPNTYNNSYHAVYSGGKPPRYVVAFRGTIKKPGNREQDFKLNLQVMLNNLHNSTRFATGLYWTRDIAYMAGPGNVWLAGHSLGSSISLLIGRHMIIDFGIHVETYLFNPPFPSPPIGWITDEELKFWIRIAHNVLTAGLADSRTENQFTLLSTWFPYLFVNPMDPICSEYMEYFEHREKVEAMGAGNIGRKATMNSIRCIVGSAMGKQDCEAAHLIPCGHLSVNSSPCGSFKEDHGIDQWWRPYLVLEYKLHQYK